MNTNFKTKQEYLTFKKEWKEEYKKLSTTIRNLRYMAKEEARSCNKYINLNKNRMYPEYFKSVKDELKSNIHYQKLLNFSVDSMYKSYYVNKHVEIAREMLENLKQAKLESQRQYLLQKEKS